MRRVRTVHTAVPFLVIHSFQQLHVDVINYLFIVQLGHSHIKLSNSVWFLKLVGQQPPPEHQAEEIVHLEDQRCTAIHIQYCVQQALYPSVSDTRRPSAVRIELT